MLSPLSILIQWRRFFVNTVSLITGHIYSWGCARVSTLESRGSFHARTFFNNQSSSQLDPDFITKCIASEQIAGHYSDAFLPEDLEELIGPFRTSPLGLVPKPHSDTFRMIQDMSYPRHTNAASSINAGVNSDDFPMAWGSFNQTASWNIFQLERTLSGC